MESYERESNKGKKRNKGKGIEISNSIEVFT